MTETTPSKPADPINPAIISPKARSETKDHPPYWQLNVPKAQQTASCPDFLLDISPRNKAMISLPQSDFHVLTWSEVQELIKTNQINKFGRSPVDHRRYLEYMFDLKKKYGSVMEFVKDERLQWTEAEAKGDAFEDEDDLKILYNDWPYGINPRIIHLCVWTKFALLDDPDTGELLPRIRAQIDEFVNKTFKGRVPAENVVWFKNWSSLKSIHSMEHFHVMLNDPDKDFVREVTRGDVAVSKRLAS